MALVVGYVWLRFKADAWIIRDWCKQNDLRLVRKLWQPFRRRLFALSRYNHDVFFVEVQDATGVLRQGWVAVGGLFRLGVDVQWRDQT
jgi:hypothetical protein